jgi:hypothetical protein
MQIFDFKVQLSGEYEVNGPSDGGESRHIAVVGSNAWSLATALLSQALAAGFNQLKRDGDRITLERGEQRLILVNDSGNLVIHMRDPTVLPHARFDGSAVLLGDLRVECGATSIVPLRERSLANGNLRRGAWTLSGVAASELVSRVLDAVVTGRGLKRGAVFGPAKGGMERWSGEAYSKVEFVKVSATVQPGGVLLEIDIVDKRGGSDDDLKR